MGERKKILFIAKNIPIPGDENGNKIIYTIAKKLSELYSVSFFYPKSKVPFGLHLLKKYSPLYNLKDWICEGVKIKVISYTQLPGLLFTYWFFNKVPKRAIEEIAIIKPDLIHAHYGMPDGYFAYLLSKEYGVPYVLTLRNHDILHLNKLEPWNPDYKRYMKVLKKASKVLVTNASLGEYFSRYGIDFELIPHGIDKDKILIKPPLKDDDVVRITCVSNYISTKNIEWVIDAVMQYEGSGIIELSIVGDMSNMPHKYSLIDTQRVKFLGKKKNDEVLKILAKSDIFALPSAFETFGLVYLEAAATYNAIIGYRGQGVWGVFEAEKEMLFCDSYEVFKSQLEMLIIDANFRQCLQKGSIERARHLDWSSVTKLYQEMYNEAIIAIE